MRVSFIKMHGLGNDFVVLDAREEAIPAMTPAIAARIADRRTGIGCDQLIVLEAADNADFRMRIVNADGGEVEACGNATRAVVMLHGAPATIETAAGLLHARPGEYGVTVDMGVPRFGWDDIPLSYAMDTLSMPVGWDGLENPAAVNVGNPHAIFFVPDCDAVPLEDLGPTIEHDPLFPRRVNVNVATIETPTRIRLRVWERGAGLTRACGTGACATAVAAMRRGLVEREVEVVLPGGPLQIAWGEDERIAMTGPATEAYRGTFEWSHFA
ncbi:diaminopimelate epimerase [Pelagerythrobacter marensis]|uniref:Diaminopimelate epimerase n=1 Tax=Pelagerythrobacter marensis TaxID=543877 RepID=A0ABZ2D3Y7_9SPHN